MRPDEAELLEKANEWLVGRRIKAVRYMTLAEADAMKWDYCPLMIFLDDFTVITPQVKNGDYNNDGAALWLANNVTMTNVTLTRIKA